MTGKPIDEALQEVLPGTNAERRKEAHLKARPGKILRSEYVRTGGDVEAACKAASIPVNALFLHLRHDPSLDAPANEAVASNMYATLLRAAFMDSEMIRAAAKIAAGCAKTLEQQMQAANGLVNPAEMQPVIKMMMDMQTIAHRATKHLTGMNLTVLPKYVEDLEGVGPDDGNSDVGAQFIAPSEPHTPTAVVLSALRAKDLC